MFSPEDIWEAVEKKSARSCGVMRESNFLNRSNSRASLLRGAEGDFFSGLLAARRSSISRKGPEECAP
jgi:hypothetical protein